MTLTYDQWKTDVLGKTIGAGECYDLSADYVARVIGSAMVTTQYGPHAGYAIGCWDSGMAPAGMVRGTGLTNIQKGDVLFWNGFSPLTPFTMQSHTAVADGQPTGPIVPVVSQNSPRRAAVAQTLPVLGIAGYWRAAGAPEDKAQGPAQQLQNGSDAAYNGVQSLIQSTAGINALFVYLTKPEFWTRAGVFTLGAVALLVAALLLFKDSPALTQISKGLTQ